MAGCIDRSFLIKAKLFMDLNLMHGYIHIRHRTDAYECWVRLWIHSGQMDSEMDQRSVFTVIGIQSPTILSLLKYQEVMSLCAKRLIASA